MEWVWSGSGKGWGAWNLGLVMFGLQIKPVSPNVYGRFTFGSCRNVVHWSTRDPVLTHCQVNRFTHVPRASWVVLGTGAEHDFSFPDTPCDCHISPH